MSIEQKEQNNELYEIDMQIKKLYEDLPSEHKKILESYNEKLTTILQKATMLNPYDNMDNDEPLDLSKKHPEILHPKHLTNSPHEIIVYIKAEVSEVDTNGNLSEIKDLCEQYYHIPIPIGIDYSSYMSKFFEKFNKNLELTTQDLYTEKKDV